MFYIHLYKTGNQQVQWMKVCSVEGNGVYCIFFSFIYSCWIMFFLQTSWSNCMSIAVSKEHFGNGLRRVSDHVLYSYHSYRLINRPWLSMKERGHLWLKTVQWERAGSFSPSLCHFSLSSGSRNSVKCTRDTMLIKTAAVCCLASGDRRASSRRRSLRWLATQHVLLHLQRQALGSIQGCVTTYFELLCLSLHFSRYASLSHSPLLCFSLLSYSTLSSLSFSFFLMALCPEKVNSTALW